MTARATWAALALGGILAGQVAGSAEAAPVALPAVERLQLDNGLEVLLIPNDKNPFVEVHLVVRAGAAVDPPGQEGLASLTAAMLTNGTPTRGEEDIARELEGMGAQLRASADRDSLALSGSVVTLEDGVLPRFLDLFVDVARRASFPAESVEKTRTLQLAAVQRMVDDHAALADAAFDALLYGDGARGRMVSGTLSSLPRLTREDLVAFRDRVLVPQHGVLAIAGAFDRAAILRWARETLGDPAWGRGICEPGPVAGRCARLCKDGACLVDPFAAAGYSDRAVTTAPDGRRRVLLVDRDDPTMNQIQWRLGADNPVTMLDAGWAPFRVGTQVLGGDFTARLNTTLRVKEGLTYGARFTVDYGARDSGEMAVSTYVAPKDVERAIALALDEVRGVVAAPVGEEELAGFKDKLTNGFAFRFETVSDTLGQYLWLAVEGVPVSWLAGYVDALRAPTAAEVQGALAAALDVDRMALVAVGNRDLLPVLEKLGAVTVVPAMELLRTGRVAPPAAPSPEEAGAARPGGTP